MPGSAVAPGTNGPFIAVDRGLELLAASFPARVFCSAAVLDGVRCTEGSRWGAAVRTPRETGQTPG